ncbi:MAG: ferritin-like domain-containing protein [Bacteroidota bacterium]|nr:ferritin-like domain-containing protein [Bacteroidota bacterium]
METMINLNDLLKHEIMDLYSAEEQIIEAMPAMIEKANNPELKRALREHLKITEEQKSRLDKVKQTFGEDGEEGGEKKGFFSRLFGGGGGEKCKGMEGLITEGEKMMSADITEEALDAAIIASAQKIEHYEISGYGTARAFARQLNLTDVERLLEQTLNEEYQADDNLTQLAVGKLNTKAEDATGMKGEGGSGSDSRKGNNNSSTKSSSKSGSKSGGSDSKGVNKSGSKGSSKGGSKSGGSSSKVGSKSGGGSSKSGSKGSSKGSSKNSSKGGSSKGGNKSGGKSSSKSGRSRGR